MPRRRMSLRSIAREAGVTGAFLSQIRSGQRPLPAWLEAKVKELGAYEFLFAGTQVRHSAPYLPQTVATPPASNGAVLLAMEAPRSEDSLRGEVAIQTFINTRKATKGLTLKGERWVRQTLGKFLDWLPVPLEQVQRDHIVTYLAQWADKPWQRHSMYRGLRTFWRWVSANYDIPNPMIDRWGNPVLAAPKLPQKVLYTMTPDKVAALIGSAGRIRDKALISLLADSGARQSEISNIQIADLDLVRSRIKVMGKGQKEGYLVFGPKTKALLVEYIQADRPAGSLFGLNNEGLKTMLQRLEARTGIHCNSHSFRRGFATELRRQGLRDLDIAELGRWSSTAMVKRYTRAYTFEDAASRYKPIVT